MNYKSPVEKKEKSEFVVLKNGHVYRKEDLERKKNYQVTSLELVKQNVNKRIFQDLAVQKYQKYMKDTT